MLIWLVENGVEVNAQDKAGRTALHQIFTASTANVAAAGMQLSSAGDVGGAASGASKTSSVRRRGSLAKMASSRLSLATNSQGAALSAALALVRKGADMSRKAYPPRRQEGGGASTAAAAAAEASAAEVGLSPLDLCDEEQVAQLVAMTGSIGKVDYFPLLHEPAIKVPNCCYVSMLVEILGSDLAVHALLPCTARSSFVDRSIVVDCEVGHPGSEKHLGLRFAGAKLRKGHDHQEVGVGLLRTTFA